MVDADRLNAGLHELGYQHHAFISYARARFRPATTTMGAAAAVDDHQRERAERIKKRLVKELSQTFNHPSVFTDSDISEGADWEQTLATSLYRSVVVIAICDPVYFTKDRSWCAREWFSALAEHERRPRVQGRGALIYATTSRPDSPTYSVLAKQHQAVDVSAMNMQDWPARLLKKWSIGLRDHIETVASHWISQQVRAGEGTQLVDKTWPPQPDPTTRYPLAPSGPSNEGAIWPG